MFTTWPIITTQTSVGKLWVITPIPSTHLIHRYPRSVAFFEKTLRERGTHGTVRTGSKETN